MTATSLLPTLVGPRTSIPTPLPARTRARVGLRAAGGALVALLALSHGANDVVTGMLGSLLPTLQRRFDLSESGVALLVAALSFSAALSQPLLGGLADRLGSARVAGAGTILGAALLSLAGAVPTLPLLFAVVILGGFGSAAFHPAATSLARRAAKGQRALAVSAFSAGGTAGVALAPLAALAVVAHLGPAGTPWLMTPAVILGAALLLFAPHDRPVSSPPPFPLTRRLPRRLVRPFAPSLLRGPVGLLSVAESLTNLASVTFSSAVPLWLVSTHGVPPESPLLGWTLATFSLAAAGGGLVTGAVSVHVSPSILVGTTRLLAPAPLLALFALEPGSAAFFGAVALAGGLLGSGLPVLVIAAQDLAPRSAGAAAGMLMGFALGAAGVLYAGAGHLQEVIGLERAMAIAYLMPLPGALLAWAVLRRHRAHHDASARRELSEHVTPLSYASLPCACGEVSRPYARC